MSRPVRWVVATGNAGKLREIRERNRPTSTYDDELPINQKRDEILEIIREHQVVVICGETGSGKSTQLPQFCLDLGRGIVVGHGQLGTGSLRHGAHKSTACHEAQGQ